MSVSRHRRVARLGLMMVLTVARVATAQDTAGVGAITGTVRDAAGLAAAGVRVCAIDTPTCVVSDERGGFRIADLRPGAYALEIVPFDGPPFLSKRVDVRAGRDGTIDIALPGPTAVTETVTVTASGFTVPPEVTTSGFVASPRDVLKGAGALQDVSRYVQSLPGVAIGTNDFRNDIIVRGGSPLENLFVVDNVEIPNLNSFANFASAGGTVSMLDAELLQDVTFLTGGYPAPYINRTSSVLQVTQREGSRDGVEGWATVGFAGAGGIAEGPIQTGRGSWVVSARRSFLDLFTDDIGIGGVPVLYSVNAKVVYDLSPRDRLWGVNVSGLDQVRLGLTEDSDPSEELSNFDIRYNGWRSATGFNWQRLYGTRGVGLLGVTHSEAKVGQQVKDLVREGVPPEGVPPDAVIDTSPLVYAEDSREGETTVKYDLTVHVPVLETLKVGGSVKSFRIDYRAASPYGSDTPYSPEPGIDPVFVDTAYRAAQTGAYAQITREIGRRLSTTIGVRFDHYGILDETRVSPRAGLTVRLTPSVTWNTSGGVYYQQPAFLFVSAFPENGALVPWRARHLVTGVAWTPAPAARATVEAYHKTYAEYPVAAELPTVSLANIGDTFDVRSILFPLKSAGRGQSTGLEVFAERRLAERWYGQANLAVSRTRHAGLDGVSRPGSFDYPFVLNVVGGYRINAAWEVSTRLSWLSGRPYTPFDVAISTAQRRGVYDLTRVNSVRAPDYGRVDLRVDRSFTAGGQPLVVFAGVQNVTNRRNVAGYTWNRRLNVDQVNEHQGLFPILGLEYRLGATRARPD